MIGKYANCFRVLKKLNWRNFDDEIGVGYY